ERTDEAFQTTAYNTWPAQLFTEPTVSANGTSHYGPNHIGDGDVANGTYYAAIEDNSEDVGPLTLNDPRYQYAYVALYDATTLQSREAPRRPTDLQKAGIPGVAVDARTKDVSSAEWDMKHDRINVYTPEFTFGHFVNLTYPPSLGEKFHLSRIQGAE